VQKSRLAIVVLALCGVLQVGGPARAQIPETFTNLKVLPKDIQRPELVRIMRGFASALGVRCVHCHQGEDHPTFKGVDFASDERETKRVARAMMKMVQAINTDYVGQIGRKDAVQVECVTCHHGVARPRTLETELSQTLAEKGFDALVARYRELRQKYHGRAAYDFGQGPLNTMGEQRLRGGEPAVAAALLALNLEFHPDAGWTHTLMGQAQEALKQPEKARAAYERAIALEPQNGMARQLLSKLKGEAPPVPAPSASPKQ
jgi:hypothetical protein